MVSRFTALLALSGAQCKPDSCGQLVEYSGEVSAGIGTEASLFFIVFMASIAFVAGVCVGLKMAGIGTKIEKEIGTQTHELERLSVNVNELTIESIKVRLLAKDLRMSGLKGELADRLEAHACW